MARLSVCFLVALLVGVVWANPLLTTTKAPTTTSAPTDEPTTTEQEPTTTQQIPTTTEQEPTTTEQEPTTTEQEPTTTEQEPTTTEQEPTTTEQEPTDEPTTEKPFYPYNYRIVAFNALHEDKKSSIYVPFPVVFSCNIHTPGDFPIEDADFPSFFQNKGFMMVRDHNIFPLSRQVSFISINQYHVPNFPDIDNALDGRVDDVVAGSSLSNGTFLH